jgi:hypothetical protein
MNLKGDRRDFGMHLFNKSSFGMAGCRRKNYEEKKIDRKRTCRKKKERGAKRLKNQGKIWIHMKTNNGKTVKAYVWKKNAKKWKDKKAPGKEQIFNKEKGTTVINVKRPKIP